MVLPVLKLVAFSLTSFLLLLWSTLPNLWSKITSSARGLLLSGEAVVKSLKCDDLDLNVNNYILPSTEGERILVPSLPSLDKSASVSPEALEIPPPVAPWPPWVITGIALMGLNSYFPQLSPVSPFWSPLRVVIPVLHWVASWWFLSSGWEPNVVSLAPLSHTSENKNKSQSKSKRSNSILNIRSILNSKAVSQNEESNNGNKNTSETSSENPKPAN
ncbi:hypothetical protein DSO57_1000407 [Entomophthora muscae]|uniref:Uncharacterized protein n=1 Tax=Entomophthora muscae TaxID=34485 RepID=A0ACC2UIN6_9FUNG|nr:hypothetical protein DSO57_1000407 [Entomophthora muscae]